MLIQCCQMSWGIFILKYLWVNTLNIIYIRSCCCCSQFPTDLKSQRPICITCKGTLCNIILTPTGLEACSMFTNCCRYTIGLSFVFLCFKLTIQILRIHILGFNPNAVVCVVGGSNCNTADKLLWFLSVEQWPTLAFQSIFSLMSMRCKTPTF